MLNPDFLAMLTDWMIATVARHAPKAGSRPMYGGLVFERELGTPKTCVCGIYAYGEHISIEFTHGAALADPMGVLEGAGKARRHIKLRIMGDILAKDVEGYITRAFAAGGGDMKLGYTIIYVADVTASVAFYTAAFGLTCRFQTPEGDYAELETGAATLSFARDDLAQSHGFSYAPNRADAPAAGIEICLLCDDVQAAFDHAIAAGGVIAAAPATKSWGQTVAYLRDVNGVLVELATPMA